MSLPRYPEYKDSGVDWLGEVPAHWAINPFYSLASERTEPNSGMLEDNLLTKKMIEAGACAIQIENQVSDAKQWPKITW